MCVLGPALTIVLFYSAVLGPVIHNDGPVRFYGSIEVEDVMFSLDDALIFRSDGIERVFSLLTVWQTEIDNTRVELLRLYRPGEIYGGALPYHAPKEVIWSNSVVEVKLEELCGKVRSATLDSRRAFISRSDFPDTAYFYHAPEVYWIDVKEQSSEPVQVDCRPLECKTSEKRKLLSERALQAAHSQKRVLYDDLSDVHTSASSNADTEPHTGTQKTLDVDLTQSESLPIDLGKSTGSVVEKSRNRLRRLSSETEGFFKDGNSMDIGTSKDSVEMSLFDSHPIGVDDGDDGNDEMVETPPSLTVKTTKSGDAIWTLENDDADELSPKKPRDKDDWVDRQVQKTNKADAKAEKRNGNQFRASLGAIVDTPADLPRSSNLASASTRLNNYTAYASDDGLSTTTNPPTAATATFVYSTDLSSSPSERSSPLPVKTWRPPGLRQTTISFTKSSASSTSTRKNGLDSAVLATTGLSVSPSISPNKSSTSRDSSSTKKKAFRPLSIDGMPANEDASPDRLKSPSKTSTNSKRTSPPKDGDSPSSTKKRSRTDDILDGEDEEAAFLAEIGVPATGPFKLRKMAPTHLEGNVTEATNKSKRPVKQAKVEEEEDDDEMADFIVSDDEEIEYDTKTRFIDEEPTHPTLKGYLDDDNGGEGDAEDDASFGRSRREAFAEYAGLDVKTAFMRYLQYLVSSVINPAFASTWAGEGSRSDSYFKPALHKIRDKVSSIKNSLLASSVWSTELKHEIDRHPIASCSSQHGESDSTCQICRRKHITARIIHLSGIPYDCEAFWNGDWIDNPSEDGTPNLVSLRAGITCAKRVLQYHQLQHLQYYLVQHIKPKVAQARSECGALSNADELEVAVFDKVMAHESWLEEMHMKVEMLLETSLEFGLRSGAKKDQDNEFSILLRYDE